MPAEPDCPRGLYCLTVRQLWAWAIAYAGKDIENRTTDTSVRGWVGIHAGKGMDRMIPGRSDQEMMLATAVALVGAHKLDAERAGWSSVADHVGVDVSAGSQAALDARGAIICLAHLVDSHRAEPGCCESPWAEHGSGYVWHRVFDRVIAVDPPIECRGALGWWHPTPDVVDELEAILTVNLVTEL